MAILPGSAGRFGLLDLAGNVMEVTSTPMGDKQRVGKGGDFYRYWREMRASYKREVPLADDGSLPSDGACVRCVKD